MKKILFLIIFLLPLAVFSQTFNTTPLEKITEKENYTIYKDSVGNLYLQTILKHTPDGFILQDDILKEKEYITIPAALTDKEKYLIRITIQYFLLKNELIK